MADIVNTIWVYPSLLANTSIAQADFNPNQRDIIVRFTNESDSTGESAVTKIDKSALRGPDASGAGLNEPGSLAVMEIEYSVDGFNYVVLSFDRTVDQRIAVLKRSGRRDWSDYGGVVDNGVGDTGDIILSTDGAADGSCYDITMVIRLKQ